MGLTLRLLCLACVISPMLLASEYYYVICGYEDAFNSVGNSHTFARFMEVPESANQSTGQGIKNIDISWLPADFDKTLSLGVWVFSYPGKSFSFEETLEFANRVGAKVKCGEVIPTTQKHFQLAEERLKLLQSGSIKYQALVPLIHNHAVGKGSSGSTNCIYSVGDMAPLFDHETKHGWAASVLVNSHLLKNGFRDLEGRRNLILEKFIHDKIRPFAPTSYLETPRHSETH